MLLRFFSVFCFYFLCACTFNVGNLANTATSCSSDSDCQSQGGYCDISTNTCQSCPGYGDSNCDNATAQSCGLVCSPPISTGTPCQTDSDCGTQAICSSDGNSTSGTCISSFFVDCVSDTDCPAGGLLCSPYGQCANVSMSQLQEASSATPIAVASDGQSFCDGNATSCACPTTSSSTSCYCCTQSDGSSYLLYNVPTSSSTSANLPVCPISQDGQVYGAACIESYGNPICVTNADPANCGACGKACEANEVCMPSADGSGLTCQDASVLGENFLPLISSPLAPDSSGGCIGNQELALSGRCSWPKMESNCQIISPILAPQPSEYAAFVKNVVQKASNCPAASTISQPCLVVSDTICYQFLTAAKNQAQVASSTATNPMPLACTSGNTSYYVYGLNLSQENASRAVLFASMPPNVSSQTGLANFAWFCSEVDDTTGTLCPGENSSKNFCGYCSALTSGCVNSSNRPYCVALIQDDNNCGTCGNQCQGGTFCLNGSCQCPQGEEQNSNGQCVSSTTPSSGSTTGSSPSSPSGGFGGPIS